MSCLNKRLVLKYVENMPRFVNRQHIQRVTKVYSIDKFEENVNKSFIFMS